MATSEILPLTTQAIATLLKQRRAGEALKGGGDRRRMPRWPFPGTAELWIPGENGVEYHVVATSLNLSVSGIGVRCDEALKPGLELSVAIHEPEASFHGRAVVRHCTAIENEYLMGLEFLTEQV